MTDPKMFQPRANYVPRVAAIHDLCGYGKCSLAVVMPVLAAAGIDVCPVPTALFSAHTGYPHYTFRDTSEDLPAYIDAWQAIDVELDALYSGFLGSGEQIQLILDLAERYPSALRFIDPVMGDNGQPYKTYTEAMCQEMKRLAQVAELLTPNLTEASLLTGLPYEGQAPSQDLIDRLLDALLGLGAKHVVLKGIQQGDTVTNIVASQNGERQSVTGLMHPLRLHGTGDLFCSVLVACLVAGKGLIESTRFATELLYQAVELSSHQPDHQRRGVNFEPLIRDVACFTVDRPHGNR